jgi:hypothetical protein
MMLQTSSIYSNGKVFKEIELQILVRKVDIRNLENSINKTLKLAGINGPKGDDGMGIDYSRVTSSTPSVHIGLDDAVRLTKRDSKQIEILKKEISALRQKKKKLIQIIETLDGTGEQIFYHRIIMCETQEEAADKIGISCRQLQRIEKSMKSTLKIIEI